MLRAHKRNSLDAKILKILIMCSQKKSTGTYFNHLVQNSKNTSYNYKKRRLWSSKTCILWPEIFTNISCSIKLAPSRAVSLMERLLAWVELLIVMSELVLYSGTYLTSATVRYLWTVRFEECDSLLTILFYIVERVKTIRCLSSCLGQ